MRKTLCILIVSAFAFAANIQTIYSATDVSIHRFVYNVCDLWQHKDLGTTRQNLVAEIPSHGVPMVRLNKMKLSKNAHSIEKKSVLSRFDVSLQNAVFNITIDDFCT